MKQAGKIFTIVLAIVLGMAAQTSRPGTSSAATAAAAPLPSEQTVNEFMRHMFAYDPAVQWQILKIGQSPEGLPEVFALLRNGQQQQSLHFYITPDGKHALTGEMLPFAADPFAETRQILSRVDGPSRGAADAPLTIVEFSDLQCPSCRQAAPTVEKLLSEVPNARFVFQNFPLPIHDWAFKAAGYADCLARTNQEAFWKFALSVYDAQPTITPETADEKLTALAAKAGADGPAIARAPSPRTPGRASKLRSSSARRPASPARRRSS